MTFDIDNLLPCPFCGSSSVDPAGWASTDRTGPACDECGATTESLVRWNVRPEELRLRHALDLIATMTEETHTELTALNALSFQEKQDATS